MDYKNKYLKYKKKYIGLKINLEVCLVLMIFLHQEHLAMK